jgi:thiamine pyrophosphate-dependent acetolactate synthase large subunit-like protein
VDFATVARGFGLESAGPVTTPEDLPAALARAVEVVATGRPYLLDVVTTAR